MIIPDKNLFIVTSSVKPVIGVYGHNERYQQTIKTLQSVRERVPDAIILLVDVSVTPLDESEKKVLGGLSTYFLDMSNDPQTYELSKRGMKSQAENMMLYNTLMTLKYNPQVSHVLNSVKRIFKLSARSELEEGFDIKDYDGLFGKFVFKTRIPTWMNQIKHGATDLFITRMFSLCPSLIDTYLTVIQKNLPLLSDLDTEHAHFVNIPQQYLIEKDRLYCFGHLAGNGQIEYY